MDTGFLVQGPLHAPRLSGRDLSAHEARRQALLSEWETPNGNSTWELHFLPPDGSPPVQLSNAALEWDYLGCSETGEIYIMEYPTDHDAPSVIWVTDGSEEGLRELMWLNKRVYFENFPINANILGHGLPGPYFLAHGDWVVFPMEIADDDWELFISDGTPDNTRIIDLVPGPYGSFPQDFMLFGDDLYFRGGNADRVWCIWKYDFTTDTAEVVLENAFFSRPDTDVVSFAPVEGGFYFDQWNPESGECISFFNTSDGSVTPVLPASPVNWSGHPRNLKVMGDHLYFSATEDWLPYVSLYRYSAVADEIERVKGGLIDTSIMSEDGSLKDRWGLARSFNFFETQPGKFIFEAIPNRRDILGQPLNLLFFSSDGTPGGTDVVDFGDHPEGTRFDSGLRHCFQSNGAQYLDMPDIMEQDIGKRWLARLSGWPVQVDYLKYVDFYQLQDKQLTDWIYHKAGENIVWLEISDYHHRFAVYGAGPDGASEELLAELFFHYTEFFPYRSGIYVSNIEVDGFHYFLIRDKVIVTDGTQAGTRILDLFVPNPDTRDLVRGKHGRTFWLHQPGSLPGRLCFCHGTLPGQHQPAISASMVLQALHG